ncbi:MAG TPA: twin-arginine translocase subunit TatC [Candidatus Binatia bacterium]|nr:twin-arginine translocase subunit TatC [Candidatus Binatia bacterium]
MPLTAHLEELRWRIVRALVAVGIAFAVCWWFAEALFTFLIRPLAALRPDETIVIGTGVAEAFFTKLKVSFIAAIFVASPVIFFQSWRFVAPGLYQSEKRLALPFAAAASFFFVTGAAFCYALVFPVGFRFFLEEYVSIGVAPQIRISEYLTFAARMLLAFGLTFELPVVTFFLARLGVVTHRSLIGMARYAIVAIFVVAAVLTPGPDVASQLLMAAPLFVLYALSILIAWLVAPPATATDLARSAG